MEKRMNLRTNNTQCPISRLYKKWCNLSAITVYITCTLPVFFDNTIYTSLEVWMKSGTLEKWIQWKNVLLSNSSVQFHFMNVPFAIWRVFRRNFYPFDRKRILENSCITSETRAISVNCLTSLTAFWRSTRPKKFVFSAKCFS